MELRRDSFRAEDLAKVEGDFVVLNSGGPLMSIEGELEGGLVLCRWNDGGETRQATFRPECLSRLVPYRRSDDGRD